MRENMGLYRGKKKSDSKWTEGYYVFKPSPHDFVERISTSYIYVPSGNPEDMGHYEIIIPETVGQYIGQPDKNGKKIFEGDIIKTKYGRICKVVWFAPQFCWGLVPLECKSKVPDQYDLFDSKNLEVIGNIYDNSTEDFNTKIEI